MGSIGASGSVGSRGTNSPCGGSQLYFQMTPRQQTESPAPFDNNRITFGRNRDVIGSGSYGSVFRGLDTSNNSTVAVKEIALRTEHRIAEHQQEVMELQHEIEVMRRLHHPNIVRYLGYAQQGRFFRIYMEYASGGTISSILSKFGPMSSEQAAQVTRQTTEGLLYLHQKNIVHRDLKGDNIFLKEDGTVKIGDFGTARHLDTLKPRSNSLRGTAGSLLLKWSTEMEEIALVTCSV